MQGEKRRIRPESFADHYSQARQFYLSQTKIEQTHIAGALTFELSKVQTGPIRVRVVSHLRHIDEALAKTVADQLGIDEMPEPAKAAAPVKEQAPSDALSILKNGPASFAGRRVGALVTDGSSRAMIDALKKALEAEGAELKIVAPKIFGIKADDGSTIPADELIDGGPSILFDAVAILPSADGAKQLAGMPPARDFVADAVAHCKFVAHNEDAAGLFKALNVTPDGGFCALSAGSGAAEFVKTCRALRFWDREAA